MAQQEVFPSDRSRRLDRKSRVHDMMLRPKTTPPRNENDTSTFQTLTMEEEAGPEDTLFSLPSDEGGGNAFCFNCLCNTRQPYWSTIKLRQSLKMSVIGWVLAIVVLGLTKNFVLDHVSSYRSVSLCVWDLPTYSQEIPVQLGGVMESEELLLSLGLFLVLFALYYVILYFTQQAETEFEKRQLLLRGYLLSQMLGVVTLMSKAISFLLNIMHPRLAPWAATACQITSDTIQSMWKNQTCLDIPNDCSEVHSSVTNLHRMTMYRVSSVGTTSGLLFVLGLYFLWLLLKLQIQPFFIRSRGTEYMIRTDRIGTMAFWFLLFLVTLPILAMVAFWAYRVQSGRDHFDSIALGFFLMTSLFTFHLLVTGVSLWPSSRCSV